MKSKRSAAVLLFVSSLVPEIASSALNNTPPLPDTVYLQKACDMGSTNCTSDATELRDWIYLTKNPNVDTPLLVNIGPGEYHIPNSEFFCLNDSHITFKGAGQESSVLTGGVPGVFSGGAVLKISGCSELSFQDMTIRSDLWRDKSNTGGSSQAVLWIGGGNSTWTNIQMQGNEYAWYDFCSSGTSVPGKHYWFASRIEGKGGPNGNSVAYNSACGDTWFYGGEVRAINDGSASRAVSAVVASNSNATARFFGTAIRAESTEYAIPTQIPDMPPTINADGFGGLSAAFGGQIHVHGGIVAVRASSGKVRQDVYGVFLAGNGIIHTPGTAFVLEPGSDTTKRGVARRVIGDAVQAPFQWPKGDTPPVIESTSGSDLFVETDCDSIGDCSGSSINPLHPHLMIYDSSCNGGSDPWFDVTRGKCRGEP